MRSPLGRLVILACAGLIFFVAAQAPSQPGEILVHTRATYAALQSYADTGVATTEYRSPGAPPIVERHTFSTLYKSPRQYRFDFQKDPKAGAERFVVWGEGEDFHTWWSATQVHDTYPRGRGATAFALGSLPTKGTVLLLAPLLFPQAGLHGSIADLTVSGGGEIEDIGGRRCHKIVGEVRSAYGTGAVAGARPATVWIDVETFLVRKIFEDTPSGTGGGITTSITTTLEPQANPTLEDDRFRFTVPTNQTGQAPVTEPVELMSDLTFTRVGGFIGYMDRLEISKDGIVLQKNRVGETTKRTLSKEEIAALAGMLHRPGLFAQDRMLTSEGADRIFYTVRYRGVTISTGGGQVPADLGPVVDWCLKQLR